jgi:hypothetical protein
VLTTVDRLRELEGLGRRDGDDVIVLAGNQDGSIVVSPATYRPLRSVWSGRRGRWCSRLSCSPLATVGLIVVAPLYGDG